MSHVKIDASGILPLIARIGPSNQKMMHIVATQVAKDTVKYVPMRTGNQMLRSGAHLSDRASVKGNKIIYPGPYARYLYKGKVVVGPLHGPKHATDKDLVFSDKPHKKATAYWFEESKKANIHTWRKVAKRAFLDGIKK